MEDIVNLKAQIDKMSHYKMCRIWRFGTPPDNKWTSGEVGEYFTERLFGHFGGFTPEISKSLEF